MSSTISFVRCEYIFTKSCLSFRIWFKSCSSGLKSQAAAPSTAAVADAAGSERINVTLPRGVMDDLKRHALAEGRSCGNLAAYLLEEALRRHRPLG